MNESLTVHTLKQFKLTDISKVWLALINISDTIKYSDYQEMHRVYPPADEPFVESDHGYLKYAVETSGQVNFIFNSILMFNDKEEMLCYVELDPQNLNTVDSWVVKISAAYDTEGGETNYYIDYLAIYKTHASNTRSDLAQIHDNLNLDEAITVTQARPFASTDITTRYIEQTINTVSTTTYDAVERLVVPARQDDGQSTLIKRYVNKRDKVFRYQDLKDKTNVKAIDSTTNTTILPSKIVDAVSTGTLLTYFTPRLAASILELLNGSAQDNLLTANDIARSYRYGSVYVDQTSGAGFFLPIYKHTDEPTRSATEGGINVNVRIPAYKELRGCAIIPNGINKKVLLFKFTGLGDDLYDFKRIAPRYAPMAYTHIVQFMNGKALYWSKQVTYETPIEENASTANQPTGLENPWVYINGNTGVKTEEEQNTSFKIYYTTLNTSSQDLKKLYVTNIHTVPALSAVNMYLSRLDKKGPIEYTEFKNYCINTRDKIKGLFLSAEGSGNLHSIPRNYVSWRILSAASQTTMPGASTTVITDWSDNLKTDTFDYKATASGRWFVETPRADNGGKELFDLKWDDLLSVYHNTVQSSTPLWDGFTNFVNSHSGKNQSLYLPIGIDQGSPGQLMLDELPTIPEVGMDVINPIIQESEASRKVLNQIGAGIKSQALTMTQEVSEAINSYVGRTLAPYEDDDGKVGNDIGIEIMACDNGILEVRDDETAIYITVIKYSGKANNRVFRQVINKDLLNENNDLNPYFTVSYSNNILCYRMRLKNTCTAYTSFYDLTKENPFTPILSNADRFVCTRENNNTDAYRICTLYHGYGMLFETEFMESIPQENIYNRSKFNINGTESTVTTETHGRKLIRREYFLPDD